MLLSHRIGIPQKCQLAVGPLAVLRPKNFVKSQIPKDKSQINFNQPIPQLPIMSLRNCRHNLLISRAATQIPCNGFFDVSLGWTGIFQ